MQGFKTFAGAKVQQKNDICKKWGIFLRKMSNGIRLNTKKKEREPDDSRT